MKKRGILFEFELQHWIHVNWHVLRLSHITKRHYHIDCWILKLSHIHAIQIMWWISKKILERTWDKIRLTYIKILVMIVRRIFWHDNPFVTIDTSRVRWRWHMVIFAGIGRIAYSVQMFRRSSDVMLFRGGPLSIRTHWGHGWHNPRIRRWFRYSVFRISRFRNSAGIVKQSVACRGKIGQRCRRNCRAFAVHFPFEK